MRRPMSSIFTIRATTPYAMAVMNNATMTRIAARAARGSSITSFRAITMISADKMKSVRTAPATVCSS